MEKKNLEIDRKITVSREEGESKQETWNEGREKAEYGDGYFLNVQVTEKKS